MRRGFYRDEGIGSRRRITRRQIFIR